MTTYVLWTLMPILLVRTFKTAIFDVALLLVLVFIVCDRLGFWDLRQRKPRWSWSVKLPGRFYAGIAAIIAGGLLSGFNITSANLWLFEVVTFVYLLLMCVGVDMFANKDLERFLKIGAWALIPLCYLTGVAVLGHQSGLFFWKTFYQVTEGGGTGEKFRGLAYATTQWGALALAIVPLLMVLLFDKIAIWKKGIVVGAMLMAALTIPATSSRSNTALIVLEPVIIMGLYVVLNRDLAPSKRLLYLIGGVVLTFVGGSLLSLYIGDSWVFQRAFSGVFSLVEDQQVNDRWRMVNWGWAMTEYSKHPLLGLGFGNFELLYDRHEVHSTFISLLAEAGPMALLGYISLYVMSLTRLGKLILANAHLRKPNGIALILFITIGTQGVGAFFHGLSRNRHIYVLLALGVLYATWGLTRLQNQRNTQRAQRHNTEFARIAALRARAEARRRSAKGKREARADSAEAPAEAT